MKQIEEIFGGANAEEQNVLLHIIKERGYEFFEKTPKTTMTVRLLEDLHKLGYKIVKQGEQLPIHVVVRSCYDCQNMISTSDEYGYTYIECIAYNKNLNLVDDKEDEAKDCDNFIAEF